MRNFNAPISLSLIFLHELLQYDPACYFNDMNHFCKEGWKITGLVYMLPAQVLKLRSCQLSEIPDKFLHTPRYLERLDISDNALTAVPQELAETKNLLYLNLNQNPIVRLVKNDEDYP